VIFLMQGSFVSYDLETEFVSHALNGKCVGKISAVFYSFAIYNALSSSATSVDTFGYTLKG
jgi:hypothetical protein